MYLCYMSYMQRLLGCLTSTCKSLVTSCESSSCRFWCML
jgi:hypothetical protein